MKYSKYWLLVSLALGDGYIQNRRKSNKAYLDIAHHFKHKDYIEWKKNLLDNIQINNSIKIKNKSSGNTQYRVLTKSYIIINNIKRKMYVPKKQFLKKYVYNLDDLSLALLWMDDGCLIRQKQEFKGKKYIYLCSTIATEGFDYASQENIIFWLKYKFNIEARIGKSRNNFRICLNRDNTLKLIKIVEKYVKEVPSMYYKIDTII